MDPNGTLSPRTMGKSEIYNLSLQSPTGEILDAIEHMLYVPQVPTPMAAFLLWIKLLRG